MTVNGSPKRKLKVLCLHGYRQNAAMFREKTGAFRKAFQKYATFEFIDAPHVPEIDTQTNDGSSSGNDDEKNTPRAWWFSKAERTFSSRDETQIADGFSVSMDQVIAHLRQNGPYDGIMGFSQGASMAHLLAAAYRSNSETPNEQGLFKFAIIVAGFKSLSTVHDTYNAVTIRGLPTLHIYGTSDEIVHASRSEKLVEAFVDPEPRTVLHAGGHCVPPMSKVKNDVCAFFESIREDVRPSTE
uniref:FSH1 domain-containing protein n=1 Tax=Steinernema glaseri TaxID=37863 RepID=A0A1I8A3C7_9BILA